MTVWLLIVGLTCCGGAICLAVLLMAPRDAAAPTAVDTGVQIDGDGRAHAKGSSRGAATEALYSELPPLLQRFHAVALKLSPRDYGTSLRRRLDLAGNPPRWPAKRVLAVKGMGLPAGALLGALFGLHHGGLVVLLAGVGAAAGWFLPDLLVNNAGQKRQAQLRAGLPDALDMLTVCVEAGLGFDAALARVATQLKGPLGAECTRMLQEMQLGMSRGDALRMLAARTDVPELRTFVSAFVQASELGISVGDVLREQAKELRDKRRQWAEEKAQKLPVKILFPLIFCLMPAMFVVILGPAALSLVKAFGGGGV